MALITILCFVRHALINRSSLIVILSYSSFYQSSIEELIIILYVKTLISFTLMIHTHNSRWWEQKLISLTHDVSEQNHLIIILTWEKKNSFFITLKNKLDKRFKVARNELGKFSRLSRWVFTTKSNHFGGSRLMSRLTFTGDMDLSRPGHHNPFGARWRISFAGGTTDTDPVTWMFFAQIHATRESEVLFCQIELIW